MPGGLYSQNPMLLDRLFYIMNEKAKQDEVERNKKQTEMGGSRGMKGRIRGKGRRR